MWPIKKKKKIAKKNVIHVVVNQAVYRYRRKEKKLNEIGGHNSNNKLQLLNSFDSTIFACCCQNHPF